MGPLTRRTSPSVQGTTHLTPTSYWCVNPAVSTLKLQSTIDCSVPRHVTSDNTTGPPDRLYWPVPTATPITTTTTTTTTIIIIIKICCFGKKINIIIIIKVIITESKQKALLCLWKNSCFSTSYTIYDYNNNNNYC